MFNNHQAAVTRQASNKQGKVHLSKIIRAKLAKEGKLMDSPEMAMAKLMNDGYTHVAVLFLQTIPGEEFHELYQNHTDLRTFVTNPSFRPLNIPGKSFPCQRLPSWRAWSV